MLNLLYIICVLFSSVYSFRLPNLSKLPKSLDSVSLSYINSLNKLNKLDLVNRNKNVKMHDSSLLSYNVYSLITNLAKSSNDLDKWNILDFINEVNSKHVEIVSLLKNMDTETISGLVAIDNNYDTIPELPNLHYLETGISNLNDLVINTLVKNDINYVISNLPSSKGVFTPEVANLLLNGLMVYIFYLFISSFFGKQGGMSGINPMRAGDLQSNVLIDKDDINTTFDDVAGCDEAKLELEEIVSFLKNPDKFNSAGAKIPKGILLEGPPGTGKTLLARAVAGEADVAFLQVSASEFVQMFVGVGASRVRDLFNLAKDNTPCIIFIDEIDAVGRKRGENMGGGGNEEREQTLNQILTNMDGFDKTDSIVVMAATNRADILDSALTRSGRFDRKVTIPLPDKDGRRKILDIHLRNKFIANNTDLDEVAAVTSGFSGADIENMANEAVIMALRNNNTIINTRNLVDAYEKIAIGIPQTSREYNYYEQQTVAYHESGHAITALLFKEFFNVRKVTIVSNSNGAGGYTLYTPTDDYKNYPTKKFLLAQLIVILGGRAAEIVLNSKILSNYNPKTYNTDTVFDEIQDLDITTGASSDLKMADSLARMYVELFGIENDGTAVTIQTPDSKYPYMVLSDVTKNDVDDYVSLLVNFALKKAIKIIESNMFDFTNMADDLIMSKSIDTEYLRNINITYFY